MTIFRERSEVRRAKKVRGSSLEIREMGVSSESPFVEAQILDEMFNQALHTYPDGQYTIYSTEIRQQFEITTQTDIRHKSAAIVELQLNTGHVERQFPFHTLSQSDFHNALHSSFQSLEEARQQYKNETHLDDGKYSVIFGCGVGAVFFHEACGHLLEGQWVSSSHSVFSAKDLGKAVSCANLTLIDDPTIPNLFGSQTLDDEGTPTQEVKLIENGILNAFLADKQSAVILAMRSTGSARGENIRNSIASRMSNTFVANGELTRDSLIAQVSHGILALDFGPSRVNKRTGDFQIFMREGYEIVNGKIKNAISPMWICGNSVAALKKIRSLANNFSWAQSYCGGPSGVIPVSYGQPDVLIDDLNLKRKLL